MEIIAVRTPAQWRDFHRLPYRVYAQDPCWVPPLLLERKMHFSPKHNPFFAHATAAFWLAYKNGAPVGRISAQIDRLHLQTHKDATGHFGFLEALDDPGVFRELLGAAESWIAAAGLSRAVGPISFSLWDEAGLLVDGFDTPPFVMMGHARPYYADHVAAAGYRPLQDLLAYSRDARDPPAAAARIVERGRKEWGIETRPMRMDRHHFDADVALILDILNDAWSDNWGFVPMTAAEIADLARMLKLFVGPKDVTIGSYHGQEAAFAVAFPNINEAIRDLGGRLLPFGWAKLLWRLKVKGVRSARMPLMGVRKTFQNSHVGAALALSVIQPTAMNTYARGVRHGELSWILDQNERVKHVIGWFGGVPYKRYRIYEKPL